MGGVVRKCGTRVACKIELELGFGIGIGDWRLEIGDWITNADVRGGYKRGCWVYVYKDLL